MTDKPPLASRLKRAIRDVDASADVVLYGSRAREEAHPTSDWDFLILLDTSPSQELEDRLRQRFYEIELETGEVINPIVRERASWRDEDAPETLFRVAIRREGVEL